MSDWDISDPLTCLQIAGVTLAAGVAGNYIYNLMFGPAAPVAAPVLHFPQPRIAHPPALMGELLTETADIRFRHRMGEFEDGKGHIMARHGPQLSDAQLQSRLTTGLDSEGVPAPTAGVSSKFSNRASIVDTMNCVVATCFHQGLKRTTQYLRPAIQGLAAAQATLAAANGPAAQIAAAEMRAAKTSLQETIEASNGMATADRFNLPVYWNNARSRIELFQTYCITCTHPGTIGTGYYGTGPQAGAQVAGVAPKGIGKSKQVVRYARANAYNGPLNQTMTVLKLKGDDRIMAKRLDMRVFTFITHYPTGRMAGGPALEDGFASFSGTG